MLKKVIRTQCMGLAHVLKYIIENPIPFSMKALPYPLLSVPLHRVVSDPTRPIAKLKGPRAVEFGLVSKIVVSIDQNSFSGFHQSKGPKTWMKFAFVSFRILLCKWLFREPRHLQRPFLCIGEFYQILSGSDGGSDDQCTPSSVLIVVWKPQSSHRIFYSLLGFSSSFVLRRWVNEQKLCWW